MEDIEYVKYRLEELEQQNSFECQCVAERDEKLAKIRRRILLDVYPKAINSPDIQQQLIELLKLIEE